ncbi:MAG: class I SAM-dependent methyltransferase [Thermoanaerobaculia bacterium]
MSTFDSASAAAFWDREITARTHVSWMENSSVRRYINEQVSGTYGWPLDWFERRFHPRFRHALSVGCGTGALERDLVRRGICESVDAYDASAASIQTAQQLAAAEGLSNRLHYFVGDFNRPKRSRRRYDAVFFHQSLHHVARLEALLRDTLSALSHRGVVYLDEYIGPSRFEWDAARLAPQQAIFATLPASVRKTADIPPPIHEDDPSEALRSSEIVPLLERGFEIVERRDYGGTLLAVAFPVIDFANAPSTLVDDLIVAEKNLIRNGAPSYYAIIVARPKRGLKRQYASLWYWFAPKARRIRYEILRRLRPNRRVDY